MALAADADGADPEVQALAMQVPDARMLPFVILADSRGAYLAGNSGLMSKPRLIEMLEGAPDHG